MLIYPTYSVISYTS